METSYMEITRDIIQLIFTPIMLLIILGYQYFKIKNLKDQLAGHDRILDSIQTYFNILSPEMINQRVEMYEKILEKEKKIDVEKMASKLLKATYTMETTRAILMKTINSAINAIADSFVFVPNSQRVKIVNEMKDDLLRDVLTDTLPKYREIDAKFKTEIAIQLLADEKEDT